MRLLVATLLLAAIAPPHADWVRHNARVLPGLGRFPETVGSDIAPYRALLIGELHGTREAPRLALELARTVIAGGRAAWLGLEIPVTEQAAMDTFRETGDASVLKQMPFFRRPAETQDGRASAAMAAMLVVAQKLSNIPIYCLDPVAAAGPQERDEGMAREVARRLAQHPGATGVTLTGSVHARNALGTPWDPTFRPMAYNVAHGVLPASKVLTIDLQYQNATAWNSKGLEGGGTETGIHTFSATASAFTSAVPWGAYFLKLPAPSDGYGAIFFWRTLSASPPFVPAPSVQLPTPTPRPTRKP